MQPNPSIIPYRTKCPLKYSYMSLFRYNALILSLLICFAGTSTGADEVRIELHKPRVDANTALQLMTDFVISRGTDLQEYNLVGITFNYFQNNWSAMWEAKQPVIGGHFMVIMSTDASPVFRIVGGA